MISRLRDDFYATGHPGPADILLLVEVSDSSYRPAQVLTCLPRLPRAGRAASAPDQDLCGLVSLRFDRTVKLPLYARAGVGEVWIVSLVHRVVDAYRGPAGDGYGGVTKHQRGEEVALVLAPETIVRLDLMFG